MIVYYFVIIFSMFFIALKQGIVINSRLEIKTIKKSISFDKLFLALVPMIFIFGMRSGGVGDTEGYYTSFKALTSDFSLMGLDDRSYGFSFLQRFCKSFLFTAPELWMLTIELLAIVPLIYTVSKYSINVSVTFFVFFASTEFSYLLNGARQFIAVCIMFYAFKFIVENKPVKYYLFLLLAVSFHLTALIMLPVYFFARLKAWRGPMIVVVLLLAVACLFSENLFATFDEVVLQDSVYAHYSWRVTSTAGVSIFRVLVSFVPVILAFVYRKNFDSNNIISNACINLSALNAIAFLFASTMGANLMGRLTEYFNIYNLLLYPYVFEKAITSKDKRTIKFIFIISYLFFFYYQMVITWDGLPYVSEFLNISING